MTPIQNTMLIGLTGRKRSGKDTTAGMIVELAGHLGLRAVTLSFAEPLKQVANIVHGVPMEHMRDGDKTELTNVTWEQLDWEDDADCDNPPQCVGWQTNVIFRKTGRLTVRELLQYLGTDLFRDRWYPDVWIDCARRRVREAARMGADIVVMTDVRFANEAAMVRELGGVVWAVIGPYTMEQDRHASEALGDLIGGAELKVDNTKLDLWRLRAEVEYCLLKTVRRLRCTKP